MKKWVAFLLSVTLLLSSVCTSYAEGWGSMFSNAFGDIDSIFESDTAADDEDASDGNWLENLGKITTSLFHADTGIPKEIHYGDYELFKQDIDTLEAFFQAYADFISSYDSNDLEMLADYAEMLALYSEAMLVLDALDTEKMSAKEERYYLNSLNRINQMLFEALGEL